MNVLRFTTWPFIYLLIISVGGCAGIQLTAFLSQHGLHGTVVFEDGDTAGLVKVTTSLLSVEESTEWSWSIRALPVDYNLLEDRCSEASLGATFLNLDGVFGKLSLPGNESSEVAAPPDILALTGDAGIWGRSLLLEATDGSRRKVCSTLTVTGKADEKVAEARFTSPVAGSIYLRWVGSHHSDSTDTLIYTNLHSVMDSNDTSPTEHGWKIYATDILDTEADKSRENCDFLQLIFNPVYSNSSRPVGDLEARLGKVKIAGLRSREVMVYHDSGLTSITVDLLSGQRSLYIVIFDLKHQDSFLACGKIRAVNPAILKSIFQYKGVKGDVTLTQRSPFDPTSLRFNLSSSDNFLKISAYRIHDLPPPSDRYLKNGDDRCLSTGTVYNPANIPSDQASGSQDTYPVGDLYGKHNVWRKEQTLSELNTLYWDSNLPLFGPFRVAHRSLVLYRSNPATGVSEPWICSSLLLYTTQGNKVQMTTASVIFRYPIVGRMLFRQAKEEWWTDTSVLVESLIHADGNTQNDTNGHRWMIHELPPGKDFYNWTGRCLSSGKTFNPFKVTFDNTTEVPLCDLLKQSGCLVGDLSTRHGPLGIAGRRMNQLHSRRLFTDSQLPLSGVAKIVGRSLVLYDDFGPKARGERLACSMITLIYRKKAVVYNWFGNGEITPVNGKIEVIQQTEYDISDVEVDIQGLDDNKGYHVHIAPLEEDLEFPCEDSTVYGHWNPYNITPSLSPPPAVGTSDEYEMGDFSGKYGTLENLQGLNADYNDTNLPLFGPNSILGRSVVIHKREKNRRWACGTIERGYSPSEARERRGIASFHNPLGHAYGYVRMTQLIYNDGSHSETVLEVKLRHPGKNDRNITRNHNWAIFVNPVGVDATVAGLATRCVAGGYRWNPYYTQLADPLNEDLYREECGPDNPLRCYVGDLSGRLGPIDLGTKRQVFSDINFPLEGAETAMGKSIVIMTKERGGDRFACANIELDHDIIKFANIRKPPKFVMALFIAEMRDVLGVPEWMLTVDSRKTKILHMGACIQFLVHFKGPVASQLDKDFTFLLSGRKLSSPTLSIPGVVPDPKRKSQISYRPCGSRTATSVKDYLSNGGSTPIWASTEKFTLVNFLLAISVARFL